MNRILVEIIAQYSTFLELADESLVSLETALRQQEDLAFQLQKLSEAERAEFIHLLREIAEENPYPDQREYLMKFPEQMGIA